ncbi:Unknown protein, partial [Striga hermonthica]
IKLPFTFVVWILNHHLFSGFHELTFILFNVPPLMELVQIRLLPRCELSFQTFQHLQIFPIQLIHWR